jgi:flagellar biosynthesis protein FlhG
MGQKLLVVGGGRGGVGKTLMAENLAVYLAQLGKVVALVDADAAGSNLHLRLGVDAGVNAMLPDEDINFDDALVPTDVPGLSLLPYPHDSVKRIPSIRGARRARWVANVRNLDADYVIVDVGPGAGEFQVDLLSEADVGILVTTPEPPAVEATYRFLRATYLRRLRRALVRDRLRLTLLERALAEIGRLPSPLALLRVLAPMDQRLAEIAWGECCARPLSLVVNQTRTRNDAELGAWIAELCERHYGLRLTDLGHVEYDDTVWVAVRRRKPLLVDSPATKAARNIERIARRAVSALSTPERELAAGLMPYDDTPNHYAHLGIGRGANDEETRRAYKRKREVYANGSLAISSLFTAQSLRREQSRLDEAYDTLLDPIRRRAYDLSTFPADEAIVGEPEPARSLDPQLLELQSELLREIGPDTEYSGQLLRRVRESQGLTAEEISKKTRIGAAYIVAIEDENARDLPSPVYVRGFVAELAKYLRLDPVQVQSTYMRRFREQHRDAPAGGPLFGGRR